MKCRFVLMLSLYLYISNMIACNANAGGDNIIDNCDLKSEDDAISRANLYTGFNSDKASTADSIICIRVDNITNDKTPFIDDLINNCPVWKILYKGIEVGKGTDRARRDFEVIMDQASGKLLSIYSYEPEIGKNLSCQEPEAEIAEAGWRSVGYMKPPDNLPEANFLDALDEIVFNPARVRIIRAMYVDIISDKDSVKNWWIIIARGSEVPFQSSDRGDYGSTSLMFGIDGMTGRWDSFTNPPGDFVKENKSPSPKKE